MWKIQKKFANAHLRHFAEGKKTLENHIQQECYYLCEAFKEEHGMSENDRIVKDICSYTVP